MGFNWRQFLCTSNVLMRQRRVQEPHLRSAVSRAYYAAYHVAKEYAETRGGKQSHYPVSGSHEWVARWYTDHGHTGISSLLLDLRKQRKVADYVLNIRKSSIVVNQAWAEEVHSDAVQLIQAVSKLP